MKQSLSNVLAGILISFCGILWASEAGIDHRLRDAAAELSLAESVLERVETSFRKMQENPDTSPEQVVAMEQYVQELKEVVKLRRETMEDLEAISGKNAPEMDPEVAKGMKAFDAAIEKIPDTAAPETEEERLDREFRESLENFDGMILAHNEKLEDKMDERISKGEAAMGKQQSAVEEAEALLASMGVETAQSSGQTGEQTQGEPEVASTETTAENSGESPTTTEGGQGRPGGGQSRPAREDEDIVARQLREAAEKETDPILREKLWKEYEAYLDGRS